MSGNNEPNWARYAPVHVGRGSAIMVFTRVIVAITVDPIADLPCAVLDPAMKDR